MKISGVSLIQKVQGGTYRVKFRDPKTNAKHQRKASTGTKDYEIALRIAQELSLLIRSRAYWNSPPEGLHPKTLDIWGVIPAEVVARRTASELDDPLLDWLDKASGKPAGSHFVNWDGTPFDLEKLRERVRRLLREYAVAKHERDQLREDLRKAHGLLRKMGQRVVREQAPKPIAEAIEAFFASGGTGARSHHAASMRYWFKSFASKIGPQKDVFYVEAEDVCVFLEQYKKKGRSPGYIRQIADNLRTLLRQATGGQFNEFPVKEWCRRNLKREEKEWYWLEKKEADRLIAKLRSLHGDYWADAAILQRACGFRPEELPLLQTGKVKQRPIRGSRKSCCQVFVDRIVDDRGIVIRRLKTKRSHDWIEVPSFARKALERRMAGGGLVLFPRNEEAREKPRWSRYSSFERQHELWPAADKKEFSKQYLKRLRAAAAALGMDAKRIDSRTLRRTCGKELLLSGKSAEEVAAVLRDHPETVRRYYARLLAADVSTER